MDGSQIPAIFVEEPVKKKLKFTVGRPEDKVRFAAFQEVVAFLENTDTELVTIRDLVQMMQDILKNQSGEEKAYEAYSVVYIRRNLLNTLFNCCGNSWEI